MKKTSLQVQEFINIYKICNKEIFKICENICGISMIKFRPNYVYGLEELLLEMQNIRLVHDIDKVKLIHLSKTNSFLAI